MNMSSNVLGKLNWIVLSVGFFKNHFFIIVGLGLLAALGRAAQLKAFGPISDSLNVLLEIGIASARIMIFLYTLGLTNVRNGAGRIMRIFSAGGSRRKNWQIAVRKLKSQWSAVALNLAAFLIIAWAINYLIDYAAYQTCLYAKMKSGQIVSGTASKWAFILFLKNISVIPFTLVFNALFLLWITNKLTGSFAYNQNSH